VDRIVEDSMLVAGRRLAVGSVLLGGLCSGVASADPSLFVRTKILSSATLSLGAALWCVSDATLRRRYELWHAQWQLWACWPLYVPAYIVATRRWRGAGVLLGIIVVLGISYIVGQEIGGFVVDDSAV
jgi:hypothetical protein